MSVTVEGRRCEWCGKLFAGRADARFCSTAHRVAAHRATKSGKSKPKPNAREMTNVEVMAHLEELKALSRKWKPDALDALTGREVKRQVRIAEQVALWLTEDFVQGHAARVTPLAKVPT